MRSSNPALNDYGNKLLPKIIKAVTLGVISAKTGLTEHELNVRINSGQELIDRMGDEGAELYRPLLADVLKNERMSPVLRDFIGKAASGKNQWQAAGEFIFSGGGIAGAFGSVLDNAVSQVVYALNRLAPDLKIPVDQAARAAATGIYTFSEAAYVAAGYGYDADAFDAMVQMSKTYPDVSTVAAMVNRGLIDQQTANTLYARQGYEPDLTIPIIDLQQSILSIADAALAVLRGDITLAQGKEIARNNGYSDNDFNTFLLNTGEPPGAQELSEALRRGFIDEATFKKGILQSRVRDEWIPTLLDLRYSPLNTADAVNAYVEGYVDEATVKSIADQNGLLPEQYKILVEAAGDPLSYTDMMRLWRWGKATESDVRDALKRGRLKDNYIDFALALKDSPMSVPDAIESSIQGYLTKDNARDIAALNGLRAEDFEPLWLSAGDPLPKEEMLRLLNRGEVTEEQVKDALRQSRLKDSYIDTAIALRTQLPALYEVRTLLADGTFTPAQGTQLLLEGGYSADVVKAIVDGATGTGSAASKNLTLSIYTNLYQEGALTESEFAEELGVLGYSVASASLLVTEIDFKLTLASRTAAIGKVRAAYTAGKFTEQQAQDDLNALGVNAEAIDRLISDWDIIKSTDIKLLTPAQVTDAWFMNLFNQDDSADNLQQALTYLTTLGYDGPDAILLLSIKNKGPLTDASTKQQGGSTTATTAQSGSAGAS